MRATKKRKPPVRITRKLIRRCWVIGSAGDLKGWMDRFIDELGKALGLEIKET